MDIKQRYNKYHDFIAPRSYFNGIDVAITKLTAALLTIAEIMADNKENDNVKKEPR